ncbi:MAG: hypothetical protein ACI92Z_003114 [Paracoccaceae bacterium]|jgi:hypothetical protein
MINRRNILKSVGAASLAAVVGLTAMPAVAQEMMVAASGVFEGRSKHVTSGSVKIINEGGRTFVELGEDFSLDGGPDPRVAFGKDGEYDPKTILGALLEMTGKQRYALPSTLAATDYNEVYIWCEVAGVPLGVASLK